MPAVSIIIPVYNKEKYLDKTIESVLNQSFTDYELIFVNDGSTDGSLDVIRHYAVDDDRIIILNIQNGGVSNARNTGMDRASGRWIQFLDGDDIIDPFYLFSAVKKAEEEETDILFTDFIMKDASGNLVKEVCSEKEGRVDFEQLCVDFMQLQYRNGFFGFISNKLFRRSLLKETKASFDREIKLAEDLDFYVQLYSGVKKAYYLPIYSFTYLQTEDNYSYKTDIDYHAQLRVRLHIYWWIKQAGCYERYREKLDLDIANYAYFVLFDGNEHGRNLGEIAQILFRQKRVMACVHRTLQRKTINNTFQRYILQALEDRNVRRLNRLFRGRSYLRSIYRMFLK